jgi:MazG family protein
VPTDTTKVRTPINAAMDDFCKTIKSLRDPETGCPWDLEQTHETLRRYMIEEAYEASEVMHPINYHKLCEELGDVLLQVVLNAQIASEEGHFNLQDVIRGINQKMIRRHPHVFERDNLANAAIDSSKVKTNWEKIKAEEQSSTGMSKGFFSDLLPSKSTPAMQHAVAIGKRSKKIDFDWSSPIDVFKQSMSEFKELEVELSTPSLNRQRIYEELGDVMFSLAQLCRHLDIDPEVCTMDGNAKFLQRFKNLEKIAHQQGLDVTTIATGELERLWSQAKSLEKSRAKNQKK